MSSPKDFEFYTPSPNIMRSSSAPPTDSFLSSRVNQSGIFRLFEEEPISHPQVRNLVDMIQEDFPRTPSPVHGIFKGRKDEPISRCASEEPATTTTSQTQLKLGRNINKYKLEDLKGQISRISRDQFGSRYLQSKFTSGNKSDINMIFKEIEPDAYDLFDDSFSNYVAQQLFVHCTTEQRTKLFSRMIGHVMDLSMKSYACRVLQCALSYITEEQQVALISEMKGNVLKLASDRNANHVLQVILECVPSKHLDFIYTDLASEVVKVCCCAFSCRICQRALEFGTPQQIQPLIDQLVTNVHILSKDKFGNYVIQALLAGKNNLKVQSNIFKRMKGHIFDLSIHKFSSNCVEKLISHCDEKDRVELIEELLQPLPQDKVDQFTRLNITSNKRASKWIEDWRDGIDAIVLISCSQYGNYISQRIFDVVKGTQRMRMIDILRRYVGLLENMNFGRHILGRLQ